MGKTVHLLNAAVMPQAGHYDLEAISIEEFAKQICLAFDAGNLRHYIGYQSTLNLIVDLTGIELGKINAAQTELEDGDVFYVARLRRRVSPASKRVQTRRQDAELYIDDFDFFRGEYYEH